MNTYWLEHALLTEGVVSNARVTVADGRFAEVVSAAEPLATDTRLHGLTLPGFANAHSHAFHRALRSRTQTDKGSFWTWREIMYRAAERLTPDGYHALARGVFAEMALAGMTAVGEFHYLHHQPDGSRYSDPNAMGTALFAAASEAGIRITLLDTLYLHGGLGATGQLPPAGAQVRFSDGDAERWAERVAAIEVGPSQRVGAAVHSVRAVDPSSISVLAEFTAERSMPVHAHVSEQPAENEACIAHHGRTPTALLEDAGILSPRFTSVHATHLTDGDISAYASCGCAVCFCPTTERDLGDGIGPSRELVEAGVAISHGSDSHAIVDPFEECRALELDERLRSIERGVYDAADLLAMGTIQGHQALGFEDAGTIAVGQRADLVSVGLDSVRMAGVPTSALAEAAVFAASATDVHTVVVDGREVVRDGQHLQIDAAAELQAAITDLLDD